MPTTPCGTTKAASPASAISAGKQVLTTQVAPADCPSARGEVSDLLDRDIRGVRGERPQVGVISGEDGSTWFGSCGNESVHR
jgi:hypothetical protein